MYIHVELDLVSGGKITIVPKYIESLQVTGNDRIKMTMISGKIHHIRNTLDFLSSLIPRE